MHRLHRAWIASLLAVASCGHPTEVPGPDYAPFRGTWVLVSHFDQSLPTPYYPGRDYPIILSDTLLIGLDGPSPVEWHMTYSDSAGRVWNGSRNSGELGPIADGELQIQILGNICQVGGLGADIGCHGVHLRAVREDASLRVRAENGYGENWDRRYRLR
jgi:hypothetical protein